MTSEPTLAESLVSARERRWAEAITIAPRLTVANNIRQHFGTDSDIDPGQQWIYDEASPRGHLPSIGVEIELWWSHVLPRPLNEILKRDLWSSLSEAQKTAFNSLADPIGYPLQSKCQQTVALGVPHRGNDGLWEFSHAPTWQFETLACEVGAIADAGLLPDSEDLPLHITLGGVGGDELSQVLLRVLEIAGGTNPDRLLVPLRGQRSWSAKGQAGVNKRHCRDLQFGQQTGVEFRTLAYKNAAQFYILLERAQWGGALIKRLQHGDPANSHSAQIWRLFQSQLEKITGMPVEHFIGWPNPTVDKVIWMKHIDRLRTPELATGLADALDQAIKAFKQQTDAEPPTTNR